MVSTTLIDQGNLGNVKFRTYTITNMTGGSADTIEIGTWRQIYGFSASNSTDDEGLQCVVTANGTAGRNAKVTVQATTAADNGQIIIWGK